MQANELEQLIKDNYHPLLLKVSEKREYLEDLLSGKLYMNSSGYFRKVENDYRGDKYDGMCPVNPELLRIVLEDPESGERLALYGNDDCKLQELAFGFGGDDKVPIYCMSLITADKLVVADDTHFRLNEECAKELSKFGQYFTVVYAEAMVNRLEKYNKTHADSKCLYNTIKYLSLDELTRLRDDKNDKMGPYQNFFKKRDKYVNQCEWRIVLDSEIDCFQSANDHLYIIVEEFPKSPILPVDMLSKPIFSFS